MSVNVHCDSARRFYAVVSIVHNLYAIKLRQIVKIEIITIHVNAIIGTILRRIRHLMKLLESNWKAFKSQNWKALRIIF